MSRKGIDYGEDHNSRQRCVARHERRGTIYRLAENGVYSACAQAANTIARREKRYFSATASLTMEDGEMTDLFDMNAVHVLPAPDPEENAVQRDLLARLLQSDEDRSIAGRMAEGLTVREIAAALGMSKSAVQRRIDHIRNRARLLASA